MWQIPWSLITSFIMKDNSVHLYECSPFWVFFFALAFKKNDHVYCSVQTFVYVIRMSNIIYTWRHTVAIETQFQTFLLYTHYRNTCKQGSKFLQTQPHVQCCHYLVNSYVQIVYGLQPPMFHYVRNFTRIAQYWLVPGEDSSVISQSN